MGTSTLASNETSVTIGNNATLRGLYAHQMKVLSVKFSIHGDGNRSTNGIRSS